MHRALDDHERAALVFMIEYGTEDGGSHHVSAEDRRRWLAQVADVRVAGHCACGTCPSVDLTVGEQPAGRREVSRVVLQADAPGALLLLFMDEDRPSYLELAPIEPHGSFAEFPPPGLMRAAPAP